MTNVAPRVMRTGLLGRRHLAAAAIVGSALLAAPLAASAQEVEVSTHLAPALYEVAFDGERNLVYVTSAASAEQGGAKVFGLDPATLEVVETIDVSAAPGYGLGINHTTQTLYTTNTRDGSVHSIDLETGTIVATIRPDGEFERPPAVREVIADEANNLIYVSVVGGGVNGDIWVIDGSTNEITATINNIGTITGLAFDADRSRIYATDMNGGQVVVIDAASRNVIARLNAWGARPTNIAFDAANNRVFLANQGTNNVTVVDITNGDLLATVATGAGALGVTYDAERNRVYVANRQAGTVSIVDGETYEVIANLETGTYPNTAAVDPETGNIYVTNKAQTNRDDPTFVDPNGDVVALITQ